MTKYTEACTLTLIHTNTKTQSQTKQRHDREEGRRGEAYLVLPSYVQVLEKRREREGRKERQRTLEKRAHAVSILCGIVMIHVFPGGQSMTSENTDSSHKASCGVLHKKHQHVGRSDRM